MSVKIYDGFIIGKLLGLQECLDISEKIKYELRKVGDEELTKLVIRKLAVEFDGGEKEISFSFFDIADKVKKAKVDIGKSEWDFDAEWVFFPCGDKTLFKLFVNRDFYVDKFCEIADSIGLKDYCYYDHTDDRPKNVSISQWKQRRNSWESVGMLSKAACEVGVCFQLYSHFSSYPNFNFQISNEEINIFASKEWRARQIARREFKVPEYIIYGNSNDIIGYIMSDEYRDSIDELTRTIQINLKDLTVEELKRL